MAHIATKRFSYGAQFGILLALAGLGFLIGQGIGILLFISKNPSLLKAPKTALDQMLVPANANLFRTVQLIAVILMFVLPALFYAKLCHKKAFLHVGLRSTNLNIAQLALAILLMVTALPLLGALRELTLQLPLGDYIKNKIIESKEEYTKQVMVIGNMRNLAEYFLTLFIMALLPGFSEELFFRGTLQNLFTRWFKNPVAAILLTAFVFSAFHFEYSDFLGRFFLGMVLGWVFYLTGNLWYNVTMHAFFNAISVTALYITSQSKGKIDAADVEDKFSWGLTLGAMAVFALCSYLFYYLHKKKNTEIPGQEILLPGYTNPNDPFTEEVNAIGNQNHA